MSEHDPHAWPESTVAALLAGLAATTRGDDAARMARLLGDEDAA